MLPLRYDADLPISKATLNEVTTSVARVARASGRPLADFSPHDLRRTASTQLHEAGYNTDWIEKCLAHEQRGIRTAHDKAEYAEQRRAMLRDLADMIDNGSWPLEPGRGLRDGGSLLLRDPGVHFAEVSRDRTNRDRKSLGEFPAAFQFKDGALAKWDLLQ